MATFYNQATLSYLGRDVVSNITTGEITEALTATKTAVTDTYGAGDEITYVVSLVNTGVTSLDGLTLTDDLGAYESGMQTLVPLTYVDGSLLYFINGILQPTPTVTAGDTLTVTGVSVPASGNTAIVYQARVNAFAPLSDGSTVTNEVTVSGASLTAPVTADETVAVRSEASLSITKSLTPTSVTNNGRITYTFVLQNTGNREVVATDDALVTDTFDPTLSGLAVSFNGMTWTEGTYYTYDETTGAFATLPGQITIPAATYTQDPATGAWSVTPGVSVVTVSGNI